MTDFDKAIEEAKAAVLPYESWERLPAESGNAYAAFCVFRDFGLERTIRKAVETSLKSEDGNPALLEKRYNVWRGWAVKHHWKERAADFDRNIERLKQTELRKTIEAQAAKQREVTGQMLDVAGKRLTLMKPDDLPIGQLPEWVTTATKIQREDPLVSNSNTEEKQGMFSFEPEFQGL